MASNPNPGNGIPFDDSHRAKVSSNADGPIFRIVKQTVKSQSRMFGILLNRWYAFLASLRTDSGSWRYNLQKLVSVREFIDRRGLAALFCRQRSLFCTPP